MQPAARREVPAAKKTGLGTAVLNLSDRADNKTAEVENIATKAGPDKI